MRRDDVLAILRAHRDDLQRFGVVNLTLFGSVARDQAGPQSDVDFLVELKRPAGYFTLARLQEYLEHLLGVRVDLLTPGALNDTLREHIAHESVRTIDAVVRNLSIIGEATRHIPDSVQALAPSVPWAAIRGMRHRIVHEYAQVDVAVVWDTVTHDLPPLIPALESLLTRPSQ